MREHIECGAECGSIGVECHMHDIGMTCEISRGRRGKHGLEGGSQRVTFDEYTIGEVNNERTDERSMKFSSSKGDKVINGCTGIYFPSELDIAPTNMTYRRTKAERQSKGPFSRTRAPQHIVTIVHILGLMYVTKAGGNRAHMNFKID